MTDLTDEEMQMRATRLFAAPLLLAVIGLAACGGSTTTIKDAGYLTRCNALKRPANVTDAEQHQYCTCVQQKAVAAGLGDRNADESDLSSEQKNQFRGVVAGCVTQVQNSAAGGSGGTGTSGTDTSGATSTSGTATSGASTTGATTSPTP